MLAIASSYGYEEGEKEYLINASPWIVLLIPIYIVMRLIQSLFVPWRRMKCRVNS